MKDRVEARNTRFNFDMLKNGKNFRLAILSGTATIKSSSLRREDDHQVTIPLIQASLRETHRQHCTSQQRVLNLQPFDVRRLTSKLLPLSQVALRFSIVAGFG